MNTALQLATLAASNSGPSLNSDGLVEWGIRNIIPILLLGLGIGIIANARGGRISENANQITNVLMGMGVIASAAALYAFASAITSMTFGS